jgi:hypothetical protein
MKGWKRGGEEGGRKRGKVESLCSRRWIKGVCRSKELGGTWTLLGVEA